jgi:uncharacterized protein (TIGR03435 family)
MSILAGSSARRGLARTEVDGRQVELPGWRGETLAKRVLCQDVIVASWGGTASRKVQGRQADMTSRYLSIWVSGFCCRLTANSVRASGPNVPRKGAVTPAKFGTVIFLALALTRPQANSAQPKPASVPGFAVVSVKPSGEDPGYSGIETGHGRLIANGVTLKRCILSAYGIAPHQLVGGPNWLDSDRFEISAKADEPTDDNDLLMLMLQGLLADRFKLVVHRETRRMSAFVLDLAKRGPKVTKVEPGEAGIDTTTTNTGKIIDAHHTSMDKFARMLGRQVELPVVNRTGLDGVYSFKLQWTPDTLKLAKQDEDKAGPSIFTAIQEQLGLRLQAQKALVDVLVVNSASKPSAN